MGVFIQEVLFHKYVLMWLLLTQVVTLVVIVLVSQRAVKFAIRATKRYFRGGWTAVVGIEECVSGSYTPDLSEPEPAPDTSVPYIPEKSFRSVQAQCDYFPLPGLTVDGLKMLCGDHDLSKRGARIELESRLLRHMVTMSGPEQRERLFLVRDADGRVFPPVSTHSVTVWNMTRAAYTT